jgi:hypothetical protein
MTDFNPTPASERGSIIVYAMLTMSVMLAIGLTLNALFVSKLRAAASARNTMVSLYTADGAAELCLYEARSQQNIDNPVFESGATFAITNTADNSDITDDCTVLGVDSFGFQATGRYRGTSRTLEIGQ